MDMRYFAWAGYDLLGAVAVSTGYDPLRLEGRESVTTKMSATEIVPVLSAGPAIPGEDDCP